ncbi:MAG: hypothetical protein NZ699_04600 [Roseiflexus sp.]|nr:hypothetical protein [Roseiflexus sp.]MCS7288393.1 hypothetical protein [Roseiflexus sp.]MDW8231178.1 hypothetical protein [Roseiflexaceae bacterium]
MAEHHHTSDSHPWAELTAPQMLSLVLRELYAPVSALGDQVNRLANETLDDGERSEIIGHMRARIDDLGRLVVLLKRYLDDYPTQD